MRVSRILTLAFNALLLAGCNLVLDIQEASVDPRLVPSEDAGRDASDRLSPSKPAATSDSAEPKSEVSDPPPAREAGLGSGNNHDAGTETDTDHATSAQAAASGASEDTQGAEETTRPALCERYCTEVMENCKGDLEQYRDTRQCLTICTLFPEGELLSDANDNTIACRLRYASNARYAGGVELAAYCRQAGPGGDDRCGSNCEGYCTLMEEVCTPGEAGIYRFDSREECMTTCQALPRTSTGYSTSNFELSDGNHVQCRIFHVTSAAMLDAEEHCEHAMGLTLCEEPAP